MGGENIITITGQIHYSVSPWWDIVQLLNFLTYDLYFLIKNTCIEMKIHVILWCSWGTKGCIMKISSSPSLPFSHHFPPLSHFCHQFLGCSSWNTPCTHGYLYTYRSIYIDSYLLTEREFSFSPVLICWGCHNEILQTGWLRQ